MKRFILPFVVLGLAACQPDSAGSPGDRALTAAAEAEAPEAPTRNTAPVEDATDGVAATDTRNPGSDLGAEVESAPSPERRVVYVDVRRPDEFAAGHVEGAILIPYTELADRWDELNEYRDADIVLYCRTGRRSGIAEEILKDAGFERLHNGGGLVDLARQGVPVVR